MPIMQTADDFPKEFRFRLWKLRRATYDERRAMADRYGKYAFVKEFVVRGVAQESVPHKRESSTARRFLYRLPGYEKDRALEVMLGTAGDRLGWWGSAPRAGAGGGTVHFWLNVSRGVADQAFGKETVETICGEHTLGRYDFDMRSDRIKRVYIDDTTKRVCSYCAAIVMEQRA